MSRSDQFMGLNPVALNKVAVRVREVGVRTMPDGEEISFDRHVYLPREDVIVNVIGEIKGLTTPERPIGLLHRYTFPSGVVYEEYVQCTPCHSGHVVYLALRRPSGKVLKTTLWSHRETGLPEQHNNLGAERDLSKGRDW